MIDAVLLDVGGVITSPDHDMLRRTLEPSGVRVAAEVLDRAHYAGIAALDAAFGRTGQLDWRQYDAGVARAAGVPEPRIPDVVQRLEAEWRRRPGWHRIIPGSVQGLRLLGETGVRLAVVSNSNGTVANQLLAARVCQVGEGHGVPVAVVVDSFVVGIEKPDPRIFELALQALGAAAAGAVHVGDTVFADVEGARAAGVRPLHLDPYGDCRWPAGDHEHVRSLAEVATLVQANK